MPAFLSGLHYFVHSLATPMRYSLVRGSQPPVHAAALAHMEKNWGRIIFISSESAVFIPEEMIHYGMTKTAQLSVARGLAQLTKNSNVTVNSILPGPTRSKGVGTFIDDLAKTENKSVDDVEKDFFTTTRPTSLIQRFATVEEIADTVVYFSSPLAAATNGASIRVDGGLIKSIL